MIFCTKSLIILNIFSMKPRNKLRIFGVAILLALISSCATHKKCEAYGNGKVYKSD